MKKTVRVILIFTAILYSCTDPTVYQAYPYNYDPEYSWGRAEFFGSYYSDYDNENNVVSLSLFTSSLYIDTVENSLEGNGQYLFLEDIFIAPEDTILPDGTYTVSKSQEPFTLYPGEIFTADEIEYTTGSFIYFLEEQSTYNKQKLIDRGTFTVSTSENEQTIICNFVLADSTKLRGTFSMELPYYDESIETKAGAPRSKLSIKNIH
ncbi:MAG: hypothetical protein PHH37_11960 [Paludibacter sp.]|nr:hypothetical protein [Paludibacter sp.]